MTIQEEEAGSEFRAPTAAIAEYLHRSVSVSYLLDLMWSGRLLVVLVTLASFALGVYSINSAGPHYMAVMRVSPAQTNDAGGEQTGASSLLADLTGGGSTMAVPKFTEFLAAMNSVEVAELLDRKYGTLCQLYSSDCNPITHQWRERTGLMEWFSGLLAGIGGLPDPNGARTANDLANYITANVTIDKNKANSIVVLSYISRKPEFAAKFLAQVVSATNDYIKAQNHETQERYVDYLSQNAVKSTNVEQKLAIDNLFLQEERQLMMTEVDVPYAAKILDGPTVAPVNRVLKTLALYMLGGAVFGLFLATCRNFIPPKWRFL